MLSNAAPKISHLRGAISPKHVSLEITNDSYVQCYRTLPTRRGRQTSQIILPKDI